MRMSVQQEITELSQLIPVEKVRKKVELDDQTAEEPNYPIKISPSLHTI